MIIASQSITRNLIYLKKHIVSFYMKTFSATLIYLSLAASVAYVAYQKNQHIGKYVSNVLLPYNQINTHNSLIPVSADTVREEKSRIPKTVMPDAFTDIDTYAKKTPKQYEKDIPMLAEYLIKPAGSDIEKARALYTWVATHIMYDDAAYNSGNYPDYSAENVLRRKKAVCEGYANLLQALCEAAGLEADKITGYSKGYGYKAGKTFTTTNHAWNAIKINGAWKLFDPTWGSTFGTNTNGKLVSTSMFDPYWFDVHPKAFIFTHLPAEDRWQLVEGTLDLHAYEKLAYVNSSIFKLGFDPEVIYSAAVSKKVKSFVDTYPIDFPTQCNKLPYTKTIAANKEILFEIKSSYADKIALIDGGSWYYFTKEDSIFTLQHTPVGKEVKISIKINWFDKNFSTIAKYKVASSLSSVKILD